MSRLRRRPARRGWIFVIMALLIVVPVTTAFAGGFGRDGGGFFYSGTQDQGLTAPLTANPQCTLRVPADPLSAEGLATPYVLQSAGTTCAEDANNGAFVQATLYDPGTGQFAIYNPLVIDSGTKPAVAPVFPRFPRDVDVALWVGFNDNVLKLTGPGARDFVNFAQQSYANSPQFFSDVLRGVQNGTVTVPQLGTANDGETCPSPRDFSIVDQDQSDNVPVTELVLNGQEAQDNAANTAALAGATAVANGSDEQLIDSVDKALGCTPWMAPDLGNAKALAPSGVLQEIQAAVWQQAPVALVPGLDDFVTLGGQGPVNGGRADLALQNLYREQVGQPVSWNDGDTAAYCANLASVGAVRLAKDATTEAGFPAPSFAQIGTNLALVLANRFAQTWALLTCQNLTGNPSPIQVVTNANGVATSATYP